MRKGKNNAVLQLLENSLGNVLIVVTQIYGCKGVDEINILVAVQIPDLRPFPLRYEVR